MQVVGIVGTAKNTGKTTALTSILEELKNRKLKVAVTSIGYDGEDIDNLTFLPKPRILLDKDTIIATSSLTLDTAKLKYKVILETDIYTPLGKIIIVKVIEAGKIVVAGPNNIRDLKKVIELIQSINPDLLFVDGAMNRMAPMYLVDKLIFSTGASRNISAEKIAEEMALISHLFGKKVVPNYEDSESCLLINGDKILKSGVTSLLSEKDFSELLKFNPESYERIALKGIFSSELMKSFLSKVMSRRESYDVVFPEPFRILLSLKSISMKDFNNIFPENVNILFSIKPDLIAITVNSFYPKYENFHFVSGYIEKEELKRKVTESATEPVIDIFDDGSKKIVDLILK
jgi:hypothetical protein